RASRKTHRQTPDLADRDPGRKRHRKQIAGPARQPRPSLRELDADQAADQSADDRLAAQQERRILPVRERLSGVLEPVEHLAADRRAEDRRRADGPARVPVDGVAYPPAPPAEHATPA